MANPIKIDIWSDIACPWCYIGKRRLESALDRFDGAPVEVNWHSYQLNPASPVDYSGNHAEYLAQHLGASPEQVRQMDQQITGLAAREGLDYHLDDIKVTNTAKAHELIHFAETKGKGAEMKERLLKAYFTEGKHVGHVADLADLAAEIGLDRAEAEAALQSGAFAKAVAEDKAQASAYGISGVPFFVIDGKYGLSGAQEADLFLQALGKVQSERGGAA
ncbi:DsbA family oxidoreductase [Paracoccus zhejiangensis]|uniref:Disulfide bond formation protein DsbA n=1 Tax=Paracoccus zhejiangensis TaxID=1077935 RepID=A0A2H5F003_9RHOB|nr:DsbA family oxidoreductase [Paracoccus zhejiangensis]AUH64863.1 disulfide bond formation protein DsbA [Paracoccus zhejiangensis]